MLTAIVTGSISQGLSALLALFIAVFIRPTPFLGWRGPLELGLADPISVNGMVWMAFAPGKLMVLVLTTLSFWLVYRNRNIRLGRIMLVVSTVATMAAIFLFMPFPWATVYAVQRAVAPK